MLLRWTYSLRTWMAWLWLTACGISLTQADPLREQAPPAVPGAQLSNPSREEGAGPVRDFSDRIYREAIYATGMDTGSLPGGGSFSSVSAVCVVLNRVLGVPEVSPYLSELEHWLEANGRRIARSDQLRPGDVILSPHSLTVAGQVGIIGRKLSSYPDFEIYSNSARNHLFVPDWSLRKWKEYYETRLGLDVVCFRVIRSPEKEQGETREILDRRHPSFGLFRASPSR